MRELNMFKNLEPVETNLKDSLLNGKTSYEQLMLKNEQNAFRKEGITGAGTGKAGDAVINRFENKQNRMLDKISDKTDKLSDKLLNGNDELTTGQKFGGAGIDALGELPGIINNFSSKPTSSQEATGKVLNMTASGAKIGANFGPWGAAAGAVIGAGAGIIGNEGWRGEMTEEADKQLAITQETKRKELIDNYVSQHTSKQIEAQKNLLSSTLGYTQIG